jgi:tRNA (guanine6-N2)-methyltransferase
MARSRSQPAPPPPPCYAIVHPGLEEIAADEIQRDLGGEVKKTARGTVIFRVKSIDEDLLRLRTTEDVFVLAWGTDQLTYRAEDLDKIQRWTAKEPDWPALLRIHHGIRPRPRGKPTYRLITQMEGEHGYLRRDARKSLARGLAGHFPDSWQPAEENASVEVWLTIDNATAVCGIRLSDASMRHRTYKLEHRPASLRPTIAACMVRVAAARPGQRVADPMCGAGTVVAEQLAYNERFRGNGPLVIGGDLDFGAVRDAEVNLRRLGAPFLAWWDATRLPLAEHSLDQVVSNPPFGKQLSSPDLIGPLYREMVACYDRVLRPGGQAVLLVSDRAALRDAATGVGWKAVRQVGVRVLGQMASICVWRKPEGD